MIDYPWHKTQALENKKPVYEDAPTERVPIRGNYIICSFIFKFDH